MKFDTSTILVLAICAGVIFAAWKIIPAQREVQVAPSYPHLQSGIGFINAIF